MKPLAAANEARAGGGRQPAKAAAAKGVATAGSDSLAKVSMKKLFGRPNIKKDGTPGKVRGMSDCRLAPVGARAQSTN